jgi:hypothetical protein
MFGVHRSPGVQQDCLVGTGRQSEAHLFFGNRWGRGYQRHQHPVRCCLLQSEGQL